MKTGAGGGNRTVSWLNNMDETRATAATSPTIVETYRGYVPPPCFLQLVKDLLKAVPSRYLAGLQAIILTNQTGETRKQKRQKVWSRNRKVRLGDALGYYSPATRSAQASICLHVDNILNEMQAWELRVPLLRYEPVASVLYHEIGHHIHAEHKPIYKGKEDVAEDWRGKLSGHFYLRHYWYLMPLLYPLGLVVKAFTWIRKRFRFP